MILVRIVAPHFVAGFETDGTVRCAAPIISYMVGWVDSEVREYVVAQGWRASIVARGLETKKSPPNPVKGSAGRFLEVGPGMDRVI